MDSILLLIIIIVTNVHTLAINSHREIILNEKVKNAIDKKIVIRLPICDSTEILNENSFEISLRHLLSNSDDMICLDESSNNERLETIIDEYEYRVDDDNIDSNKQFVIENNGSNSKVEKEFTNIAVDDQRDLIRLLRSLDYCKMRLKLLKLRNAVDGSNDMTHSEQELEFLVKY